MRVFEEKNKCTGCTACEHLCPVGAITMKPDEEGFLYPEIDLNICNQCGLCREICPFNNLETVSLNFEEPLVFAAKHVDDNIRRKSSSGGMFTAISDYVFSQGGLVWGAQFCENFTVEHKMAESPEERDAMRGSKYVQSKLGTSFPEIRDALQSGQTVLFTGTPCQNAGLSAYLQGKEYPNLIRCDLVCLGTPSPLIWEDFVGLLEKKSGKKLEAFNYRDKGMGWHKVRAKAVFENGSEDIDETFVNSIIRLFFQHLTLRPSCHHCPFTNFSRPSDITIADFWGIENHKPHLDDDIGVSLVLVNTAKGKQVFEKISKDVIHEKASVEECIGPQTHLKRPALPSPKRDAFWEDFHERGIEFVVTKYTYPSRLKQTMRKSIKPLLQRLGLWDHIKRTTKKISKS